MKVLFITASRIGDAVLSTGLLAYIAAQHPDAKVTIACGPLAVSLFEGYPNLERIIPLKKEKHNKHWLKLWKKTVGTKWDMVVDLRNSAVSRVLLANQRFVFGNHIDKSLHKVEQNAAVMKLPAPPAPKLWFTPAQKSKAEALIPSGEPVLGVGPTANWLAKTWPAERYIELVEWMRSADEPMPGCRVAVFGAPGEEEGAYQLYNAIPEDKRLDCIAKGTPGEAAAAIASCAFYIGNDSGLMHCAAAAGVPTMGLFGPSYPHLYSPWGDHADYIATPESFDELIAYDGYTPASAPCLMENLTVEAVIQKIVIFHNKNLDAA